MVVVQDTVVILWCDADVYAWKLTPLVSRVIGGIGALPVLEAACCTCAGELAHVARVFLVDFYRAGWPGVAGLGLRCAVYLGSWGVVFEGGLTAGNSGCCSRTVEG